MPIPNVKLIAMVITLIGVLIYAGSTTVSGCADYGVALGDYQYLGYCENVVYSYSIRARLVWP